MEGVVIVQSVDPRLHRIVAAQPYPLLFATISGAHLYGFPSPDSDFDLRGAHILPLQSVIGLDIQDETVQDSFIEEGLACRAEAQSQDNFASTDELRHDKLGSDVIGRGRRLEMDIVSHDVKKFFGLLLKKNGYVLEQLYSPLIVHTTPEHAELKAIAHSCITRHHSHHYFGFAETQWKLFLKESPRRVKPLLYVFRVLLTGIHLMRSGVIEANLVTLNKSFQLPYIPDLVTRKLSGPEKSTLADADVALYETEYERLRGELQTAHESSQLPESPSEETRAALNELLIRIRTHPN
jgi:predicted nucleotidyltransferase